MKQWLTSTGDEAQGVVPRLHVLPEMHIGVVEDVGVQVQVVEALRGQHHAHIITCHQHSWRVTGETSQDQPATNPLQTCLHYVSHQD